MTRSVKPQRRVNCAKTRLLLLKVTGITDGGLEVRLVDHDLNSGSSAALICPAIATNSVRNASQVGQKVDARVIAFDKKTRKLQVSIKALEIAEEKEAVAQYGSTD